jgi:hypothetical protein
MRRVLGVIPLAVLLWACGEAPVPVATVTLDPAETPDLPFPEWHVLRLSWEPLKALEGSPGEPTAFVHLWDRSGDLVRTFDHALPAPWSPGNAIRYDLELYQSALAEPLPPGEYTLTLGLYTRDGRRWPLAFAGNGVGEEGREREYDVATLTVPPVSPEVPTFTFDGGWAGLQTGSDLQVPALRWMEAEATLKVGNLGVPGSLWLRLNLPAGEGEWQTRTAGDGAPRLEIQADCSNAVETVTGPGIYEAVLPIYGTDADASCALIFTSNYKLVHGTSLEERIAALEVLAWSPAIL